MTNINRVIWGNLSDVDSQKSYPLYKVKHLKFSPGSLQLKKAAWEGHACIQLHLNSVVTQRFKKLKVTLESLHHLNNKKHNSKFLSSCQSSLSSLDRLFERYYLRWITEFHLSKKKNVSDAFRRVQFNSGDRSHEMKKNKQMKQRSHNAELNRVWSCFKCLTVSPELDQLSVKSFCSGTPITKREKNKIN